MNNKSLGNVYILGDSYSTYEDWIPEGYYVYYSKDADPTAGGVRSVEKTWWYPVVQQTGSRLLLNDSSSGTTVCYTNYHGEHNVEAAFITRACERIKDGMFQGEKVDTLLLFGATNDYWAGVPVGEAKYADWTPEDLNAFRPAFCYLLSYMRQKNPAVRVVCILNDVFSPEFHKGMTDICDHYGVEWIALHGIEKQNDHPNEAGMATITQQVLEML